MPLPSVAPHQQPLATSRTDADRASLAALNVRHAITQSNSSRETPHQIEAFRHGLVAVKGGADSAELLAESS